MRRVTLSLLALAFAACSAEAPPPIQADPAPAIQTTHRVLMDRSEVRVTGTQQGESFSGTFGEVDAAIRFLPGDLADSRVRVEIPLNMMDLGSSDRNDAVPSKTWFNMRLHPVATFAADTIRADGEGYVADGTLTVKGLQRPVSLPFTLDETGGITTMRGSVVLDRTQWNLGEAPWDTEEFVAHDVRVDVELVAEAL